MNHRTDAYSSLSAIYDPLTILFLDPVRRTIRRQIEKRNLLSVLDLCCGTGRLCSILHRSCPFIVGLDISRSMLRVARKKTPEDIEYIQADAAIPPLRPQSFDAVIVSLALHEKEAEARAAVFKSACRILKPGGFLFALEMRAPGSSLRSRIIHMLIQGVERAAGKEHFECFTSFIRNGGLESLLPMAPELDLLERRQLKYGNLELLVAHLTSTSSKEAPS